MSDERPATLIKTERAQRIAADPAVSAWVSANAGAGKTHVLKMRVLRLLLAGTAPDRILCLTYTRAAAAEMAQRVFDELSKWATCDENELAFSLHALLGREPLPEEIRRARQLFAHAIETPGGLKVQTIHAFCERLLQRFPLEAGVAPGFTILDEEMSRILRRQALDTVLRHATAENGAGDLAKALRQIISFASDHSFDAVLADALSRRDWLGATGRLARGGDDLREVEKIYRAAFSVATRDRRDAEQQLAEVLTRDDLMRLAAALGQGKKSDSRIAELLRRACEAATPDSRMQALESCFLTAENAPRSRLMTEGLKVANPNLHALLADAQRRFVTLSEERVAHMTIEATLALRHFAQAVERQYADAKARQAALDYDDLIVRATRLLGSAEGTQWVLYKLDGGLDHVLVDEAQDTSPDQWTIISALADEFFANIGTGDRVRTVFAVGDEKQSIYSFQGAAPKLFAAAGRRFAERAGAAGRQWQHMPLTLSFRSVEPILKSVDRVFADPGRTPGLSAEAGPLVHEVQRIGHAGLVEIWPTEVWQESEAAEPWSPLDEKPAASPVARLARRIADTIASWLDKGELLLSQNRPIRPGDILILVRKRAPFAAGMVAALKDRRIPVAGADRMRLTDQIAIEDLMALGEFLLLPEDDLALASVLKSPLFGLDDDDLLTFAPLRKGSLWSALLEAAKSNPRFSPAAATLRRWRSEADLRPPYEFFASILENEGMRARLLARLGPEAADPLDEFLEAALNYDRKAPPSLQGFLLWLRKVNPEIKRDQEHGRDEVRVMTVHGAKGLEAPIVFLPDTLSTRSGEPPGSLVSIDRPDRQDGARDTYVWPVRGASRHAVVQAGKAAREAAEREERNRLLYVAMTRARDRLYVAGFEGRNGRVAGCWYDLIESAVRPICEKVVTDDGREILRYEARQSTDPEEPKRTTAGASMPALLPDWALRPAPREPVYTIPLAPSRLQSFETDESGEPVEPTPARVRSTREPSSPSPLALSSDNRFLRGALTHALLEHLPRLDRGSWRAAAIAFVDLRGQQLPAATRTSIVAEVLSILENEDFSGLFGPDSRAEVPIVAEIPDPEGRRPNLGIIGQIDRMVKLAHEVLILDYKTNRPPPHEPAGIAPVYLSQLAAYRLVAKQLFPDLPVRGAILWTDGARLMPVPAELLDEYEQELWLKGGCRLDAPLTPSLLSDGNQETRSGLHGRS